MTHLTIREWGGVPVGAGGFTSDEAERLLAAARAHPLANEHGTNILIDRRIHLYAQQMVGMVAGKDCSLEILPKVDAGAPDELQGHQAEASVRQQLVQMIDVALDLRLSEGAPGEMARQDKTLLEVLIRAFADRLLAETRRGLPRRYLQSEADLPALRGRLDSVRQFTRNAVRPDRLACRFDQLDTDTPLMRIMAAAIPFLARHARAADTQRKLAELRHVFADIPQLPLARLPWQDVRIDRTNRRWESLFRLVCLLLNRQWQATHRAATGAEGITLLFPMNDLFEAYVAALLRRVLTPHGVEVIAQGGRRFCLGDYSGKHLTYGSVFQTKPDIILRLGGRDLAIIDTKWKSLAANPLDRKHGVKQSDIYQLMAYARLYRSNNLMLLYPEVPGAECGLRKPFGIAGGSEKLSIATIDVSLVRTEVEARLARLFDVPSLSMGDAASSHCRTKLLRGTEGIAPPF